MRSGCQGLKSEANAEKRSTSQGAQLAHALHLPAGIILPMTASSQTVGGRRRATQWARAIRNPA
eukprot:4864687-Pyramimonas_sp.AAC.1